MSTFQRLPSLGQSIACPIGDQWRIHLSSRWIRAQYTPDRVLCAHGSIHEKNVDINMSAALCIALLCVRTPFAAEEAAKLAFSLQPMALHFAVNHVAAVFSPPCASSDGAARN